MKCQKCGQPLEPWEAGLCEGCGQRKAKKTKMGLKTQYKVIDGESLEGLTDWTDSDLQAIEWSQQMDPPCVIAERTILCGKCTADELKIFAANSRGQLVMGLIWIGQFSCDGWYLEVNSDGRLSGNVVEANHRGCEVFTDESLGLVWVT